MAVYANVALERKLRDEGAKGGDAQRYCDALDRLSEDAAGLYSRTTWEGWVDHGAAHAASVVTCADRMIRPAVLEELECMEIFVVLAGAMLHDIGMAKQSGMDLNEIRRQHGELGAKIIQTDLKHRFPNEDSLRRTCAVVRNHHGPFAPPDDCAELALLVRLADGLDFGPKRAPGWIFNLIQPPKDQLEYWEEHLQLDPPRIDNELLRVEVTGVVADDRFIASLRENLENPAHVKYQGRIFGCHAATGAAKSYVVIDRTTKVGQTGEDPTRALIRPTSFSSENYLVAARYLYNVGHYEAARRCFEDTVRERYDNKWTERPCDRYLYHYLQTLNKLGSYKDMLKKIDGLTVATLEAENRAAVQIACGIAHLKLRNMEDAMVSFQTAFDSYMRIQPDGDTRKVNEADSRVWLYITHLERLRAKMNSGRNIGHEAEDLGRDLEHVEKLYAAYQENRAGGTHYQGRFFGLKAFCDLLNLDIAHRSRRTGLVLNPDKWDSAIDNARKAYGGDKRENRVPFGVMSGRYCEAVVYWHKHMYCIDKSQKSKALSHCARSLIHVLQSYAEMYRNQPIAWTWDKISFLTRNVEAACRRAKRAEARALAKRIDNLKGLLPQITHKKVQIFTPLN